MKTYTLILISLMVTSCASAPRLDSSALEELNQKYAAKDFRKFKDFQGFLKDVDQNHSPSYSQDEIQRYRLLGLYTRLHYREELLTKLSSLVAIPTFKKESRDQYKNPGIKRFGEEIKKIAEDYGLQYKNIDNRVFEVTLRGSSSSKKDVLGVYTHGDVVPADAKKWILPDGTKLNPFEAKIIDGKIYGRGTEDDKCSIVAALIAMKSIRESGLPLKRSIRLIIETTEETGGEGFKYYKDQYPIPPYNIVLDSGYPIIVAEKGFGSIYLKFKTISIPGPHNRAEIIQITGGTAINQIPKSSKIKLRAPKAFRPKLEALATKYIKDKGGDFKIEFSNKKKYLIITVTGVSAHSASPASGVNPVSRAFEYIHFATHEMGFHENHYTKAARTVAELFGTDYHGKKFGIDYKDEFMGPLTVSITYLKQKKGVLRLGINMRAPKGKEARALKKEVEVKLAAYKKKSNMQFEFKVSQGQYMFRSPKGNWISTLLDIYSSVTGNEAKPRSSSGSTTAKLLPNGVNFGPSMPGEKYMGHNANEFKRIKNFMLDTQMFTEAFLRLGNLDQM